MSKTYLLLFILLTQVFLVGCNDKSGQERFFRIHYQLDEAETGLLHSGDIILRRGHGFVSNMIIKTLGEKVPISHVGIIVNDSLGNLKVIHTVSNTLSDFDGIQIQPLNKFVRESVPNTIIVVRYKQTIKNPEVNSSLSRQAHLYLEQKIPFDHSFNYSDSTKFFCTELIWRIFRNVLNEEIYDVTSTDKLLERLKFYHFLNQEKFRIIIDHQGIKQLSK